MTQKPYEYDATDNSILSVCRGVEERMWHLGFAYLVEQDRKYIDRALVEALGKQVFWDDRGLIVISDEAVDYAEEEKVNIIRLLGTRVLLNGKDMASFTTDKENYWILTDGNIPTVTLSDGTPVIQSGNAARFTVAGKTYTINFVTDKFAGQFGTNGGSTVTELKLAPAVQAEKPSYATWQEVSKVTFSTENTKYPASGTIDNVILQELTTNIHHRWSGNTGSWIQYEFAQPIKLHAFGLATLFGTERTYLFKAEVSTDGANWTTVLDTQTSGTTNMPEIFELGGVDAKYFRLTATDNAKVATVDANGLVTFVASGRATITATYHNGFRNVTDTFTVECE